MRVRKNVRNMTPGEKSAFVNALLALKNQPSVLSPGQQGRYDDYVQVHMNAMMAMMGNPGQPNFLPGWGHDGPAFFPWHRVLLLQFEDDLQAASHDQNVTIPYWDWTDPASWPFTSDFLGGDGTGPNMQVETGPFAFTADTHWTLVVKDDPHDPNFLQRQFGADTTAQHLPTASDVSTAINATTYSSAPWKGFSTGFRAQAQYGIHNLVHRYVGGTMGNMTSPNDPVFWLHHCNIDRLWSQWQRQHPTEKTYLPLAGGPSGQNLHDAMIFSDAPPVPWSGSSTPQSVIDLHALGYTYDFEQVQQMAEFRARAEVSSAMVRRARTNFPLIPDLTAEH